jgi:clan AA aspartic protease
MITGVVTDNRQAFIRVIVRGPSGNQQEIEAITDTGFDGWLSLPSSIIVPLDLVWRRRGRAQLADGSESIFDIYEAMVIWDGEARRIPVDQAGTAPLVGMSLREGYKLTVPGTGEWKRHDSSLIAIQTRLKSVSLENLAT